jgi:hypothetical protein
LRKPSKTHEIFKIFWFADDCVLGKMFKKYANALFKAQAGRIKPFRTCQSGGIMRQDLLGNGVIGHKIYTR